MEPNHENSHCPACREQIKLGQKIGVLALGPGKSPEARERAAQGLTYDAVGVELHWECLTGVESNDADN